MELTVMPHDDIIILLLKFVPYYVNFCRFRCSIQGYWSEDVHPWEKQFFVYECPVTWEQLGHAKLFMLLLYKNVREWDDSAGLEAFQDAKIRYWAKINNLKCNIPLPDPDMVNHKAVNDPEIAADLCIEPQQPAPARARGSFHYKNGQNSASWDVSGASGSKWNTNPKTQMDNIPDNGMHINSERCETSKNDIRRKYSSFGFLKVISKCWKNFEGNQNLTDQEEHTIYAGKPTSRRWKSA
ncbi:hypothetical protein DsansV1_C06g0062881 [Dioscorea sansibarensis]